MEYFENLDSNKLEKREVNRFLDASDLPKLNQEDVNHSNRPRTNNENEAVINSLPDLPGKTNTNTPQTSP
jgi:hypothetical protein